MDQGEQCGASRDCRGTFVRTGDGALAPQKRPAPTLGGPNIARALDRYRPCKRTAADASGCKWMQVDASGCKWMQVDANTGPKHQRCAAENKRSSWSSRQLFAFHSVRISASACPLARLPACLPPACASAHHPSRTTPRPPAQRCLLGGHGHIPSRADSPGKSVQQHLSSSACPASLVRQFRFPPHVCAPGWVVVRNSRQIGSLGAERAHRSGDR
ncbi:uncharacterized protein BJ171DRAFT_254694 [Polychytrium aggregatum]|uniref:uncharacterized protein n=1 Tax=Polychytrium aggregatum TaxID=110093 RepID=UPI0022FE5BC7|nr:uncharacterized protein BJ171DRAFT_254694 [Polychytrium aggregatum]KAI9207749.1 hypothetical protein BJ171DRAFT_254694 [Polychytrium aggregatum]